MTILVTGGAGYIGTHICVELLNSGYDIIIVDNFATSSPKAVCRVSSITGKTFKVIKLDLTNRKDLLQLFSNESIDSVIHLAGYKAVAESTANPIKYYSNNIVGSINLFEVMAKFNVKKLVFSSSATVYNSTNQNKAISEEHSLGAINPYGHTKQIIEEILKELYYSDPEWSISVLRYFNPVGAHESGLIGEDPKGIPNNLVPYITQVAVGKLPTLFIYGNDYPTKDGTGVRDYIHVVDLALGHVRALKSVEKSSGLDVFNLGTGQGYSVLEVIRTFEKVTNRKIPFVYKPRRLGDSAICYANVTKAEKHLEWKATRGLEEMCKDAWRWQQLHPNGYDDETAPQ